MQKKYKVLLMGSAGSGKTSMVSKVFSNFSFEDTQKLAASTHVVQSNVEFFKNFIINIWDCAGKEVYMDEHFKNNQDVVFKGVHALIYVFDVDNKGVKLNEDTMNYQMCLAAISAYSPTANVFILMHKMDLVKEDQTETLFIDRKNSLINMTKLLKCTFFKTTIKNETIYQAWSSILRTLMPYIGAFQQSLQRFAVASEYDVVMLFEQSTLLNISHYQSETFRDEHHMAKVTDILNNFRHQCKRLSVIFNYIETKNSNYFACLSKFTPSTFIMVVSFDPHTVTSLSISININAARKHFESIESEFIKSIESDSKTD